MFSFYNYCNYLCSFLQTSVVLRSLLFSISQKYMLRAHTKTTHPPILVLQLCTKCGKGDRDEIIQSLSLLVWYFLVRPELKYVKEDTVFVFCLFFSFQFYFKRNQRRFLPTSLEIYHSAAGVITAAAAAAGFVSRSAVTHKHNMSQHDFNCQWDCGHFSGRWVLMACYGNERREQLWFTEHRA